MFQLTHFYFIVFLHSLNETFHKFWSHDQNKWTLQTFFPHIELLIIQYNSIQFHQEKTLVTVYYHDDVMQKKGNRVRQDSPERTCTELETLTGWPSFNQLMAGRGMPEASQLRAIGFFRTTLTFSGASTWPVIIGGTGQRRNEGH